MSTSKTTESGRQVTLFRQKDDAALRSPLTEGRGYVVIAGVDWRSYRS